MPRNGSGSYALVSGNPVVTDTTISATDFNNTMTDIATALSGSISADGQTPIVGNLPFSGFKITGAGAASAAADYATLADVQGQIGTYFVQGRTLQTYLNTDPGAATVSAVLANVTGTAQTITPKSASSTLLVECAFQAIVTASGAGVNSIGAFKLYDSTNSADIGAEYTVGVSTSGGANEKSEVTVVVRALVPNAVTTARLFLLRARASTGSPTVSATNHVWLISEVKN